MGESLNAAALLWSRAPVAVDSFDVGPLIRSTHGFWLTIPNETRKKKSPCGLARLELYFDEEWAHDAVPTLIMLNRVERP